MSWYKPLSLTYLIVLAARQAAGYSDLFSRIFIIRFSPRFFSEFCRFHKEIIFTVLPTTEDLYICILSY
jgi:hypothetical protein